VAIIAIDSSGHVGNPPIHLIASRIKHRPNRRKIHQTDALLIIDRVFHSQFENSTTYWELKFSAVLFFRVVYEVIKEEDRQIRIDLEFAHSNQKHVTRYLKRLFEIHAVGDSYIDPVIEYKTDTDYYVKSVHIKTQRSYHHNFIPFIRLDASRLLQTLRDDFESVSKIAEK
jgi:hypothetical protein